MEIGYSITLHSLVTARDIPTLDLFWRHEIRDAIRGKLTTYPQTFGKPLRQVLVGCWALRVGDYRVVYKIEKKTVHIIAIAHRSSKYRGIEKRV